MLMDLWHFIYLILLLLFTIAKKMFTFLKNGQSILSIGSFDIISLLTYKYFKEMWMELHHSLKKKISYFYHVKFKLFDKYYFPYLSIIFYYYFLIYIVLKRERAYDTILFFIFYFSHE